MVVIFDIVLEVFLTFGGRCYLVGLEVSWFLFVRLFYLFFY